MLGLHFKPENNTLHLYANTEWKALGLHAKKEMLGSHAKKENSKLELCAKMKNMLGLHVKMKKTALCITMY